MNNIEHEGSVAEWLVWAERQIAQFEGVMTSASTDSRWLLSFVLNKDLAWLRAWPEALLPAKDADRFQALVRRRCRGEPVAYLMGHKGFWRFDLKVTQDTLVPRPETERLVELVLRQFSANEEKSVVDLGTGTGAIALAIKQERPRWTLMATDVHQPTLQVAKENADNLGLAITFAVGSWFEPVKGRQFDIIVSNPPYIKLNDEHLLGPGVCFEPKRALVSGADGLDAIQQIVAQAPLRLKQNGWIFLEHGFDQGEAVRELLLQRGFQAVLTEQDLGGSDRVTLGQWCGSN